jgi:hypothetical protein
MKGKKYNLNNIRIEEKDVSNAKEIINEYGIWNVHYKLQTKQGYTYTNVIEVSKGYSRIFIHLESRKELLKICDSNEIKNKVIE